MLIKSNQFSINFKSVIKWNRMVDSQGPANGKRATWTDVHKLAEKYDCFILDQDGVVWQGSNQIGEAFKVVEWLES